MALHAKAKAEAGYRFYALYDKISREDILAHAYAQCRSNKCCAANRMRRRIASPEMFPEAEMLPHLICSRPMFIGGAKDEADQHGGA